MLIGCLQTNFSENLLKCIHFHLRKCPWNCRLRNGGHFLQEENVKTWAHGFVLPLCGSVVSYSGRHVLTRISLPAVINSDDSALAEMYIISDASVQVGKYIMYAIPVREYIWILISYFWTRVNVFTCFVSGLGLLHWYRNNRAIALLLWLLGHHAESNLCLDKTILSINASYVWDLTFSCC